MLKQTFHKLISKYSSDDELKDTFWNEIEIHYSHKKRHYHSLTHLENLLSQLQEIKSQIKDWDTVLFSLFYHDIIYDVKSQKNEENSAVLAKERLTTIGYPKHKIENCYHQILATKSHSLSDNSDTNLFTDADLSILGTDWQVYDNYIAAIRKEYAIYPDLLYKPGRKKVLKHFIKMDRIFKSEFFYSKYENQALQNIQQELRLL